METFSVNSVLLENMVDGLASGDALIGIRTHRPFARPIDLLSSRTRGIMRWVNLIVGPALLAAIGLIVFIARRRRFAKRRRHFSAAAAA